MKRNHINKDFSFYHSINLPSKYTGSYWQKLFNKQQRTPGVRSRNKGIILPFVPAVTEAVGGIFIYNTTSNSVQVWEQPTGGAAYGQISRTWRRNTNPLHQYWR